MKLHRYIFCTILVFSSTAQAAIEGLSFTSVYDEMKSLSLSDAHYINPKNSVTVHISGGLDRRLKVSLVQGSDVLDSLTTSPITVNDRISYQDREFYGKKVDLAVPSDGEYEYRAELQSITGSVIDTWVHPVVIDTTPPTTGEFRVEPDRGNGPITGIMYAGSTDYIQTTLAGISDHGRIAHAIAWSTDEFGNKSNEYQLTVSESGETSIQREIFPKELRKYTIYFKIFDHAGNFILKSKEVLYPYKPAYRDQFEIVGIYDPRNPKAGFLPYKQVNLNSYAPYTKGMKIYSNPIKVLVRIPKNNHRLYNDLGIGYPAYCGSNGIGDCIDSKVLFEDKDFVYMLSRDWRSIREGGGRYRFSSANKGLYRDAGWIDIKLDPSAPIPPKLNSIHWWNPEKSIWVSGKRAFGYKGARSTIQEVENQIQPQALSAESKGIQV